MNEIEGFEEVEPIGRGGLGDVYRAVRTSTGGTVAVKVLRDVSDSSVAWHRTRRELTALVTLSGHAHVIQLLELLDLPTGPALVMEYAPGGSIAGLLATRDGTLTVPEVVLIGRHAADALAAAHAHDIVHRDIKPQNLLIDAYGQVKLCDFGIASLARSEEFRTRTSALSMRYASPEDLDEDAAVGPPSDVYSLGATLLHLTHGAPPTLKDRLSPWTPPTREPADDGPAAALDAVIAACLQPRQTERPTAAELCDRLEAIDLSLPTRCRALPVVAPPTTASIEPVVPEPPAVAPRGVAGHDTSASTVARPDRVIPPPRPVEPPKRHRWPWIVAAIGVAAIVGVVLALVWPDDAEAPTATATPTTDPSGPAATTSIPPESSSPSADPVVRIVARPDGLAPLGGDDIVWPFGEVGECLVLEPGADELGSIECTSPHDLQRFAVDELDPVEYPPDRPFDAESVRVATDDACRTAFAGFVGIDHVDSEFEIATTRPSADTWPDGDRRFQCLLGVPDARLIGTAQAARQ